MFTRKTAGVACVCSGDDDCNGMSSITSQQWWLRAARFRVRSLVEVYILHINMGHVPIPRSYGKTEAPI